MNNIYTKNDTMRMLGKQFAIPLFWENEEVRHQIDELAQARSCEFTRSAASDIFMLGYIHGKRAERKRRNKTA